MSTIRDFENAPVGATATRDDGLLTIKIGDGERRWLTPLGTFLYDGELAILGYTLNQPVPTTAREALDLAWELAHEVKPGQVIPAGTRYLEDQGSGLKENRARCDFNITPGLAPIVRTLEPLPEPDPEPDWLDAPAVIAVCNDTMDRDVFVRRGDNSWRSEFYGAGTADLRDVTPLYPKEGQCS